MFSRTRKYDLDCEKCKKKQKLEAQVQSHRGALERFVMKESSLNS